MDVRDQFCIYCGSKKRVLKMKKRRKKQRQNTVFKMSAFCKRDGREKIIK